MTNRISSKKKENEKKKSSKRLEKQKRKNERKTNNAKKSFEDMIAYIDETGQITSTPPDVKIENKNHNI